MRVRKAVGSAGLYIFSTRFVMYPVLLFYLRGRVQKYVVFSLLRTIKLFVVRLTFF